MAKKILTLFTLLNLSVLCGAESKNLFNGKDLTGWTGNPEFWKVENGIIVGETTNQKKTPGNTFLIWEGGNLGDFELTLKARVKGNNNSGIQYRSKVLNEKTWSVGGYQMDMHPAPNYLGMMYEERGRGIIAQRGQNVVIDSKGNLKKVFIRVCQDQFSRFIYVFNILDVGLPDKTSSSPERPKFAFTSRQ